MQITRSSITSIPSSLIPLPCTDLRVGAHGPRSSTGSGRARKSLAWTRLASPVFSSTPYGHMDSLLHPWDGWDIEVIFGNQPFFTLYLEDSVLIQSWVTHTTHMPGSSNVPVSGPPKATHSSILLAILRRTLTLVLQGHRTIVLDVPLLLKFPVLRRLCLSSVLVIVVWEAQLRELIRTAETGRNKVHKHLDPKSPRWVMGDTFSTPNFAIISVAASLCRILTALHVTSMESLTVVSCQLFAIPTA